MQQDEDQDDSLAGLMQDYLTRLAARTATPGGGCLAAMNAAEAISLLIMVARYSKGDTFKQMVADLKPIRHASMQLADEDARVFAQLRAAWSSDDAAQKQAALSAAADVPAALLKRLRGLHRTVERLAHEGNQNLLSDTAIAAHLLIAAQASCELNILINTKELAPEKQSVYAAMLQDSAAEQRRLTQLCDLIRGQLKD